MNNYRIFETEPYRKDIEADFSGRQAHIKNKLETYVYPQIKSEPHFGMNIKKLVNYRPDTWRYRIGNYRFFYEIDEKRKIVFMIACDHRGKAY